MMNGLYFERKFKFWFYQISHSEAIIRSSKSEDDLLQNNIDIYIGDIDYLELPSQIYGLRIEKATKEDVDYISLKLGKSVAEKKVIVLISEYKKYYIVASYYKIFQNNLNEDELPIYYCSSEIVEPGNSIQKMDKKEINIYNRNYKFWFYQVFHHEAIIRAPIFELNTLYKYTIDLRISNIKYLEIPQIIHSLKIDETTNKDVKYINEKLIENIPRDEILVFMSGNMRYYVVASNIEFIKSNLDHNQMSIHSFFQNRRNPGVQGNPV